MQTRLWLEYYQAFFLPARNFFVFIFIFMTLDNGMLDYSL